MTFFANGRIYLFHLDIEEGFKRGNPGGCLGNKLFLTLKSNCFTNSRSFLVYFTLHSRSTKRQAFAISPTNN